MSAPVGEVVKVEQTGKTATVRGSREYVTSNTGEVPAFSKYILDDAVYGEAISSLVQKTCDVLPYDPDSGRVLVATRQKEPHSGDWMIGGRKRAGESDIVAVTRNIKRELGDQVAEMADGRLEKIDKSYDVIWDSREQPSTVNEDGEPVTSTHQAPTIFALPISESEFNSAAAPNEEYSGLRWEDAFDVIDSPEGEYHPAFRDMVADTLEQVTRPD